MALNKVALGLALGIMCGGTVALLTVWVLFFGGGEHLLLLDKFYIGYSVSGVGAVLGLLYGFVDGFIGGWVFGWLYNRLAGAGSGALR